MKNMFPGYFLVTPDKISQMWKNAVIVFDANVILSIYKYSPQSSEKIINIFEKVKGRVWLPHRVMQEVLENRHNTIGDQVKSYKDSIDLLVDLKDKLDSKLGRDKLHPFISSALKDSFDKVLDNVKTELNKGRDEYRKLYKKDEKMDKIFSLFNGKVGEKLSQEDFLETIEEAKKRFENKQPPGYADAKTKAPKEGDSLHQKNNQYGDYILWKQILKEFAGTKTPVILITEDHKEDWWLKTTGENKNIISTRPELVEEFFEICKEGLLLSSLDNFIFNISKELGETDNSKLIEETKSIQKDIALESYNNFLSKSENSLMPDIYDKINNIDLEIKNNESLLKNTKEEIEQYELARHTISSSELSVEKYYEIMTDINQSVSALKSHTKDILSYIFSLKEKRYDLLRKLEKFKNTKF